MFTQNILNVLEMETLIFTNLMEVGLYKETIVHIPSSKVTVEWRLIIDVIGIGIVALHFLPNFDRVTTLD